MSHPLVILLATAGRPVHLRRTLASLAACEIPQELTATFVVENGPPAGAAEIIADASANLHAQYRHSAAANKSSALNLALDEVDDDALIYFIDDDIELEPSVLTRYCQAAREFQRGAYFGGPFDVRYEVRPAEWLIPLLPLSARGWLPTQDEAARDARQLIGFNWAAFAGDVRGAGGFDPRFGPGGTTGGSGQEHEMQQRLLAQGARPIFVPEALVWHDVPAQRCTPEFAVQRKYRYGIQLGATLADDGTPTLGGVPRWRIRELWRLRWAYAKTLLQSDPAPRLAARLALARAEGIVQGFRNAKQHDR